MTQPTVVAVDAAGSAAARAAVLGATAVSLASSGVLAVCTGLRPIGRCRTGSFEMMSGIDGVRPRAEAFGVGTEQGSAAAGGAPTSPATNPPTSAVATAETTHARDVDASRRNAGMTHLSS